jgi:hypothetical protein
MTLYSATVVLLSPNVEDIHAEVARLLAPFDSNLPGSEAEAACFCVGRQARQEAGSVAHAIAPLEEIRKRFTQQNLEKQMRRHYLGARYRPLTPDEQQEYSQLKDELDQMWDAVKRPYEQAFRQALKNHPLKDAPDPNCDICGGSGHLTRFNAQGKFSRWTMGGRWSGFFDQDYSPRRDPDNFAICHLCNGTGNRPDMVFYIFDTSQIAVAKVDKNGHEIPGTRVPNWPLPDEAERRPWCNACAGTGRALKPSSKWVEHEGTVVKVSSLPTDSPLAESLVTPDGRWHQAQSEEGLDYNEIKAARQKWEACYRRLLSEHSHCLAVACELDPS